jgi:hypothetical protein
LAGQRGAGGGRGEVGDCSFSYSIRDSDLPNNTALLVRITSITKKPTIFFLALKRALLQEYYGENVLHMSAVAEDPSVVKV